LKSSVDSLAKSISGFTDEIQEAIQFDDQIKNTEGLMGSFKNIFDIYGNTQEFIKNNPIEVKDSIQESAILGKINNIKNALLSLAETNVVIEIKGKASPVRPISETLSDVFNKIAELSKKVQSMSTEMVIGMQQSGVLASPSLTGNVAVPSLNNASPVGISDRGSSTREDSVVLKFDFGGGKIVGPLRANKVVKDEFIHELNKAKRTVG